ncbi:MAG: tetratricopeptide repeat protein [FCB group bacterium]|nr:tetratricopeptide repeat protein [FCB group bacterium]
MKDRLLAASILFLMVISVFGQPGIDSLNNRLGGLSGRDRFEMLVELGDELKSTDPEEAAAYGQEALKIAQSASDEAKLFSAFNLLGRIYFVQYKYAEALMNFEEGLKYIRAEEDDQTKGISFYYMGVCYGETGNYDEAGKAMKTGYEYGEKAGHRILQASTLNGLGGMNFYRGFYDRAAEYYSRAALIFEELGDSLKTARLYTNIGLAYKSMENYDRALEKMFGAVEIMKAIGKESDAGIDYSNIGTIYLVREDYAEAMKYFEKSEQLFIASGNEFDLTLPLTNLGNLHYKVGNINVARGYFSRALMLDKKHENRRGVVENSYGLAMTNLKTGASKTTKDLLLEGISLAEEISAYDLLSIGYGHMSEFYEIGGDFKAALKYHQMYKAKDDSLYSENLTEKSAELLAQYETVKKEKEIESLRQEHNIQELKFAKAKIHRFFLIIGSVLGMGFTVIILYLYRQKTLAHQDLERAMKEIKVLSGLLPICSGCKKIREDGGYWSQVEEYLSMHTDAKFTHGLCPECVEEIYKDFISEKEGR